MVEQCSKTGSWRGPFGIFVVVKSRCTEINTPPAMCWPTGAGRQWLDTIWYGGYRIHDKSEVLRCVSAMRPTPSRRPDNNFPYRSRLNFVRKPFASMLIIFSIRLVCRTGPPRFQIIQVCTLFCFALIFVDRDGGQPTIAWNIQQRDNK